ncbi:Uma2 family endonuclease [Streptomyces cylindrosporus]|uniref:Uma2 family endonuclease n=1 Tax=Streptomyces cylindrosporus TaxID=2927583 RepID=A0ABS9Y3F2_9ACTN|nr:Uma2 family endonuclease [Streptomyces cylindrosporus]MCI3271747.1 Uma2 family endonuclease [Streptomyces cylindrosporus]
MATPQQGRATEDTWMFPPTEGWSFDQVKHLELPFDWELVDGVIAARGQTNVWHNEVRDGIAGALKAARTQPYRVLNEQCVIVDDRNVAKPDVMVVEVVSPGSRRADRVSKPALFAGAKVPCYWRVELDRDGKLAVHEYWLNADTHSYIPAPMHPVHHDKLVTEVPFPVEIDLDALLEF